MMQLRDHFTKAIECTLLISSYAELHRTPALAYTSIARVWYHPHIAYDSIIVRST